MDTARETKLFPRIRRHLAAGLERLRDNGWPVIQTAAAAAIAYFLAMILLGAEEAFYAPIAAVVCLSLSLGQPKRRAILVTIGVAVGLTVAYLIVLAIGVGPAQIGVVVALAVNYLFPADPERMVEKAACPIFAELVSTLEEVAAALRDGDFERAERGLSKARGIDERVSGFGDTLTAGQETARFAPLKRGELGHLQLYADAADRLDLTVRGVWSIARVATRASRHRLDEGLLDVDAGRILLAREMIEKLLDFARPALEESEDWEEVSSLAHEILERGNGAARQREAYKRSGRLEDVVGMLIEETAQGTGETS